MSWSIGWDPTWKRDIGYGVPAHCDHPKCRRKIDRGLAYVCGGEPYGGDKGCGLYFCAAHLSYRVEKGQLRTPQLCERCLSGRRPFHPKPDHKQWARWKLHDASWQEWRERNPEEVRKLERLLRRRAA